MRPLAVIIPSRNVHNAAPCALAVRAAEPWARIIVIDDGLESPVGAEAETVPGEKPFIFSRNVNIGIRAAGDADVVILNDDALLKTPGGFSLLQSEQAKHPEIGLIGAVTNAVGNSNQRNHGIGLRIDPRMVCFIAVFVPRTTIDAVGLLDERFTAYGYEDDDYCLRVRQANLTIGIHDGCFVDHASLKSTFRSANHPGLHAGREIFVGKWGAHPL